MMRSLYAGVSGLQNHQIRMDVVGNNIANVNTTGFKKGRVNFQDMLSQTMSGAARPTDVKGGVNPKQVGLGMVIASIDTIHTQGSLQTTGNNLDMGLSGNGFFILKDGDKSFYTRAGAFGLDKDGLLVNPGTGLRVQGWTSKDIGGQYMISAAEEPADIKIPLYSKDPAKATKNVDFKCNLMSEMPIMDPNVAHTEQELIKNTWTSSINMYDSQGTPLEVRFRFMKTGTNQWQSQVQVFQNDPNNPGQKIEIPATQFNLDVSPNAGGGNPATNGQNFFNLGFDNLGRIINVRDGQEDVRNAGNLFVNLNITVPNTTPGLPGENLSVQINLGEAGKVRTEDNVGITQFSSGFTTKPFRQDGFGMGYLEGIKVDDTGSITGVFSNGNNRILAQVALANFTNVGGLEKAGETNFVYSNNSGEPDISAAGTMGKGKIMSGALEMSNVDLAEQFTDMIVTQRGFQANSKTIQTSDQMLQELLTLKR
ncbi:MAG: flagellar hook protein FlgE [Spirochaetes bacterium GWD1_27_9]|nr:MAG: flagellar hook protein FlgE [Spirochaetes bacterium GWC1_27_15]OHD30446.1 MAG: flagellar hook protein FlgE [Spirochaetes bacterium GWD1_27_9]